MGKGKKTLITEREQNIGNQELVSQTQYPSTLHLMGKNAARKEDACNTMGNTAASGLVGAGH